MKLIGGSYRRAMDFSLVLTEEQIPHQLVSTANEDEWLLLIEDADAERAGLALAAFEKENAPPAKAVEPEALTDGLIAGLLFGASIVMLQTLSKPAWAERGAMDAARVVHGQWWRALTALTLHADYAHAAGNALIGAFVVGLLAQRIGSGLALLLPVLAGFAANLLSAFAIQRDFSSLGASTAVFAALGALVLLPGKRRWLQLGAGIALLTFLGTDKRADLAGHLFGFSAGATLGFAAGRLPPLKNALLQIALGLLAFVLPSVAWLYAGRG